ncbi:MAG: apolipoprotein N-acyltransferase [Deltaproteobacteria bacterium]|nr:apolipoprotein N-acyltransferase [Deltaproteobacteria bacterium]
MASRKNSPKKSKKTTSGKGARQNKGKPSFSSPGSVVAHYEDAPRSSSVRVEKKQANKKADVAAKTSFETGSAPLFSRGWGILLCVLGGLLLGLSQPLLIESFGEKPILPDAAGWLALIGYVPFAVVVHRQGLKFTFWHATLTIWVQFSIVMWWLKVPIEVYTPLGGVVGWAAVFSLTWMGACMLAAALTVAKLISRRHGWDYGWVAAVCYCGVEFLRNHGFVGGFPWANIGNSLATVPVLLQSAALSGVYGLVLLVLLVNMGLGSFIADRMRGDTRVSSSSWLGLTTLLFSLVFGALWLGGAPEPAGFVKVGLLQGNAPRRYKDKRPKEKMKKVGERFRILQEQALAEGAEIVVWPEAVLPNQLTEETTHLRSTEMLPKKLREKKPRKGRKKKNAKAPKINVVTSPEILRAREKAMPPAAIVGATVSYKKEDPLTGKMVRNHSNSAMVTSRNLKIEGRFDKVHLVPFGEYVPWPLGNFVRRFVVGSSHVGDGFHVVNLPLESQKKGIKVAATICFEGVFPEITRTFAKQDADVFFNVTNDKWYGVSSMAYQHLRMYSLRAVESGRAIARVAITGISGWIDADGSLHDTTDFYKSAVVVANVPLHTRTPPYVVIGDVIPFLCAVFGVTLWMLILLGDGFLRRQRVRWQQIGGGIFLTALLGNLVWHYVLDDTFHERDSTLAFGFHLYFSLMGISLWSNRPWAISVLRWTFRVLLFIALLTTFFGATSSIVIMWVLVATGWFFMRRSRLNPELFSRTPGQGSV